MIILVRFCSPIFLHRELLKYRIDLLLNHFHSSIFKCESIEKAKFTSTILGEGNEAGMGKEMVKSDLDFENLKKISVRIVNRKPLTTI